MPRGGKREGSGPKKKPVDELKDPVTIYVAKGKINAVGGKEAIKEEMYKTVDAMPIVNNNRK